MNLFLHTPAQLLVVPMGTLNYNTLILRQLMLVKSLLRPKKKKKKSLCGAQISVLICRVLSHW